jgi:hypothetical protein
MMEEEFYSTIKLTSGEELISKVCYLPEENSLLLDRPLLVEKHIQKKHGKQVEGFILKEWILSTYETMLVIKMESVITLTEADDSIKEFYINNLHRIKHIDGGTYDDPIRISPENFSKRMGYLGSIQKTKKLLEEIYKKS